MSLSARFLWIFAVTLILSACTQIFRSEHYQIQEEISIAGLDSVSVDIDTGQVIVLNGPDGGVKLVGSSIKTEPLVVERNEGILEISSRSGDVVDTLTVFLPIGVSFKISTFSASLEIQGSYENIEVRSTAGEVWVHNFDGDAVIWAGRGDVQVQGGKGSLVIISEHGDQYVEAFTGKVSMTSIMGDLHYSAIENDENEINIEVDHGSVTVNLPSSVGQRVNITSTSGNVNCVGGELANTVSGCEGILGSGVGNLEVRTVSGDVDLWVINSVEREDD